MKDEDKTENERRTKEGFSWRTTERLSPRAESNKRKDTVDGSGGWDKGISKQKTNERPAQQGDTVQAARIQHRGKTRIEASHNNVNILRRRDK